jgi:hypothetical protein
MISAENATAIHVRLGWRADDDPVSLSRTGEVMQADHAAKIFHDWAFSEGLMPDGPASPLSTTPAELALIQPVTDQGKQILRAKQVQAVAFNGSENEILVFTKKVAPTSKKLIGLVPATIDDVAIVYRQGVQNPIGSVPSVPYGGPAFVIRNVGANAFYTCGSSISVGNWRDAGTLGCLVRATNNAMHGLSNNHITGSCSFAGVGLPILAPGVVDVVPNGLPPFTIGFHALSLPFVAGAADNINPKENLDAAIFRIANEGQVSSYQGTAYDTPAQTVGLSAGMEVEKVGRTTGHTRGRVVGQMHGVHPIQYSAALYGFNGLVYFDPVFAIVGQADLFSDNGDSGSLITTVDGSGQRFAVGIVVGGMSDGSAPGGKITMALPIELILQGLQVTLVSGHNV